MTKPKTKNKPAAKSASNKPSTKRKPMPRSPYTKEEIKEMFRRFSIQRPEPKGELEHVNPFTLVVAVALSAQATDAGVNKATRALFAIADTPQKMLDLGEEKVRDYIKSIGLYRNKAKNVIKLSRILVDDYGGDNHQPFDNHLPERWHSHHDQAIRQDTNDECADDCPDDTPTPARHGRATKDGSGDGIQLKELARCRVSGLELRGDDETDQRGHQTRKHVNALDFKNRFQQHLIYLILNPKVKNLMSAVMIITEKQ